MFLTITLNDIYSQLQFIIVEQIFIISLLVCLVAIHGYSRGKKWK